MKKLIDANVILRYLLDDNEDMFALANTQIKSGAFTIPEVIAEVVYVLKGVYKVERKKIAECLSVLLNEVAMEQSEIMRTALLIYGEKNLDFVDCILIARHQIWGDEVFSFDKKLNDNLDVELNS